MIVFRLLRIIAGVGGPIAHERQRFVDLGWTPAAAVPTESAGSAIAVMAGSRNLLAAVSIPRIIFRPWVSFLTIENCILRLCFRNRLALPRGNGLVPSTSAECGSGLSPRRFSARGDQSSSQFPSACLLAFSSHGDTAGVSPTIWHRADLDDLGRFESFRAFRQQRSTEKESATEATPAPVSVTETPDAILEKAHGALNDELAAQILDEIADRSPAFFEKIVLDLMKAMGYGGWGEAAGRLTGAGADEGIDGLIHEDRLGLETIYLQAKRWAGSVGRPDIHKFVGALHGRRARKGVFMTTSTFTREAIDYAGQIDTKIVLVDGRTLARLMILHDVGCSPAQTFVVKKLDSDSFVEE